jgi:hypothetical protein
MDYLLNDVKYNQDKDEISIELFSEILNVNIFR